MELYFIRHGQSISNANWNQSDFLPPPDPELTEAGHTQAARLASYLSERQVIHENGCWNLQNHAGFGLTHLYTSPMQRAVDTAFPTAKALGLPLTLWPEIHEEGGAFVHYPDGKEEILPGNPRSYYEQRYPDLHLPDRLDEQGWWRSRPVETVEEGHERALQVVNELIARHGDQQGQPEQRVAIFSHGGFFLHMMSVLFKMQYRQGANGARVWLFMNNTGITRIDIRKDEILLCYVNRADHLPMELIT